MKLFYTILFFVNALALIMLTFLMLYMIDKEHNALKLTAIIFGMFLSINLMIISLFRYLNIPRINNDK